jgi:hypothetical protein
VAGQFDFASGLPRPLIARLRSDGEVDPGFRMELADVVRNDVAFQPSAARLGAVEPELDTRVDQITLQPDSGILILGSFNCV